MIWRKTEIWIFLLFVWELSSLKEGSVRTEPHCGMTCGTTLFLTGKILRLAQLGSVLRRGGTAQSFGCGVYCNHFPLKTHMDDIKHQIRLFWFKWVFGQQVLTKFQQNFIHLKLKHQGFQMPCRPILCDVYIRLWNYLNFWLFSINFHDAFDYCKIQKNLKNMIYL